MSTYTMVKAQLINENPIQLLEKTRTVGRSLHQRKQCAAFLPINRSNEARIDCYLFDVTIQRDEIKELFSSSLNCPLEIHEEELSNELQLVKSAAIVVETLLTQFEDDERTQKAFSEHFHYVLNGIGMSYKDEINFYLVAVHQLVEQLSRQNITQANAG